MKIIDLEQGSPEWHVWRESGVPASETAALFGESPYTTIRELWLLRKGKIPSWFIDQGDKEYIFAKGHSFEEKMRAEYFAMTGEQFVPVCAEHDEFPSIKCSLDGLFWTNNSLKTFEAKLVSKEVKLEISKTGVIPRHHWIQIQQQLFITNAFVCIYFAHDLEDTAVVVEIFPDLDFQQELVDKITAFELSLVNNEEPPMTKDDFEFSANDELFEKLIALKQLKDEADKRAEEIEEQYKAHLKVIASSHSHQNIASINKAVKVKLMEKPGSIKYSDIPEIKAMSAEYLNVFRSSGFSYLQAWFPKQKVKA